MNNSTRRALDIALATEARGMYAGLLSPEEKQRISQMRSTQELVHLLTRSDAWHTAALSLQSGEVTDSRFSDAVRRCVLGDCERLYRFANDMSRQFLNFITLDVELQAIMRALRRLISPPASEDEAAPESMPPVFRDMPGHSLERLRRAKTYEEISSAVSGSIYAKALYTLHLDEKTGLPSLSDAVTGLESMFFDALAEYMRTGYRGPAREELGKAVAFRADMLNISYLMRLRRFDTPGDKAEKLLLPLRGAITTSVARRALDAGSDQEALEIIRKTPCGKWLPEEMESTPEAMIRSAQNAYFRKVLHGKLNLAVVYAFLILKEYEGDMLTRVFVALRYGLDPAEFMD